jgi:hypothetical protein
MGVWPKSGGDCGRTLFVCRVGIGVKKVDRQTVTALFNQMPNRVAQGVSRPDPSLFGLWRPFVRALPAADRAE